jgi:hypothetical protein
MPLYVLWEAGSGGSPRVTTVTALQRIPQVGGGLVPWARLGRATYHLGEIRWLREWGLATASTTSLARTRQLCPQRALSGGS